MIGRLVLCMYDYHNNDCRVFKEKLHAVSTGITQTFTRKSHAVTWGCKLQMSHHMQSTYKAHRKPCYHMVIAGESHVEKHYKNLVTCKAHENSCNHMVITVENHVDVNYKCLVTCKAHVTHMTKHVTTW